MKTEEKDKRVKLMAIEIKQLEDKHKNLKKLFQETKSEVASTGIKVKEKYREMMNVLIPGYKDEN